MKSSTHCVRVLHPSPLCLSGRTELHPTHTSVHNLHPTHISHICTPFGGAELHPTHTSAYIWVELSCIPLTHLHTCCLSCQQAGCRTLPVGCLHTAARRVDVEAADSEAVMPERNSVVSALTNDVTLWCTVRYGVDGVRNGMVYFTQFCWSGHRILP